MSRKRIAVAISTVSLLLFFVGPRRQNTHPEPVWDGRSLSSWLDDLATGSSKEVREPAEEALRKIGTNALPFLLETLAQRDSGLNRTLLKLNEKQTLVRFRARAVSRDRVRALLAFDALGTLARPALPELARLLPEHQQPEIVADAMASISSESVSAILEAVPKVAPEKRCLLLESAMKWPSRREDLIIPALERSMKSPNSAEAQCAAQLLARCRGKPD